tara:strand:- start:72 stop:266 length:195 start_codon:yes stop_codon:yes gene_type:complete
MIFYLTLYLGIGCFLMFLIQHLTYKFPFEENKVEFEIFDIIVGILLWPLIIIFFIKNLKNPPRN